MQMCSEYSVCVPVTPRIHSCVHSGVFVFHSSHEHIIMIGTQFLCSSHSMNTLSCSEHIVCVQSSHTHIIMFGTHCLCSSHPMNIVLCSENSVCVFVFSLSYEYSTGIVSLVQPIPVFFLIKKVNYIYPPSFCRRLNSWSRVARRNIQW